MFRSQWGRLFGAAFILFSGASPEVQAQAPSAASAVKATTSAAFATTDTFSTIAKAGPTTAPPAAKTPPPVAAALDEAGQDKLFFPLGMSLDSTTNSFSIVFNGYRRSMMDPCGCVSHQLGGLDKEARIYDRLKAHNLAALKLDTGGFFRDNPYEVHRVRTKYLLEAYKDLGYDAINVGFADMSAGYGALKEAQTSLSLPLISANIVDETSAPVFDQYKVSEVSLPSGEKVRVGLIGVTRSREPNNRFLSAAPKSPGADKPYYVADEAAVLKDLVPRVRQECDVLVLMVYGNRQFAETLAVGIGKPSPVDIVMAAEFQGGVKDVNQQHGFGLVSSGFEGKQTGHTIVTVGEDKKVTGLRHRLVDIEQTIPPVPEISKYLQAAQKELMGGTPAPAAAAPKASPGTAPAAKTEASGQ